MKCRNIMVSGLVALMVVSLGISAFATNNWTRLMHAADIPELWLAADELDDRFDNLGLEWSDDLSPSFTGALAVDDLSITGNVTRASVAVTTTDGAAITLSSYDVDIIHLSNTDAAIITNTFGAVAAASVGRQFQIYNAGTNIITQTDAAPAYLSAAHAVGPRDSFTVEIKATNEIVQIGGPVNN